MLTAGYDIGYKSVDRFDHRKLLHICYGALKSDRPFDTSLHPTS